MADCVWVQYVIIFYVLFQIIVFEEQKADDKILFAENPNHGKTIDVYKMPFCTLL